MGGEAFTESTFDNWSDYQHTNLYAGPVISYQGNKHWWATVTPVFQLTDTQDEPDFQLRLIFGLMF